MADFSNKLKKSGYTSNAEQYVKTEIVDPNHKSDLDNIEQKLNSISSSNELNSDLLSEMIRNSKSRSRSKSSSSKSNPVNPVNQYFGNSRLKEYETPEEKALRMARFNEETKRLEEERKEANKVKREKELRSKAKAEANELEKQRLDYNLEKENRWNEYEKEKNKKLKTTTEKILKKGGPNVAEDIIWHEGEKAGKLIKDTANYAKNKVQDIVENPDVHEGVKKAGKVIRKGLGAAQGAIQTIDKDMMAYGQAKALINGTAEMNEEVVRDKYGNVTTKRTFKNRPKENGTNKTTFGLKNPIQPAKEKAGPVARKGKLETRKGKLGRNTKSRWDKEEREGIGRHVRSDAGLTGGKGGIGRYIRSDAALTGGKGDIGHHVRSDAGLTKGGNNGPTNHHRSDAALTKGDKGGIGRHVNSKVQLVQSDLPTLEQYNEAEPNIFGEDSFGGFAKNSFAGFEKKDTFHPINKGRSRAPFESTVAPQKNMLGKKKGQ